MPPFRPVGRGDGAGYTGTGCVYRDSCEEGNGDGHSDGYSDSGGGGFGSGFNHDEDGSGSGYSSVDLRSGLRL
jgi:hypothetical protein